MPRITALRHHSPGAVAVDVDGAPWRVVPADVVARADLAAGLELDRERLRQLRRELRRAEALTTAARMLRSRDRSTAELHERLTRTGFRQAERDEALAALTGAGIVDDARLGRNVVESLLARDAGNAAIRERLERLGLPAPLVESLLAGLAPEEERAERVVARRGESAKTLRYLSAKGFSAESVETLAERVLASDA